MPSTSYIPTAFLRWREGVLEQLWVGGGGQKLWAQIPVVRDAPLPFADTNPPEDNNSPVGRPPAAAGCESGPAEDGKHLTHVPLHAKVAHDGQTSNKHYDNS